METEDLYKTDCIRTYTGKYVNVFEPTEDMICIEDIAHALSNQCRFAGHTQSFHSVAEHCITCAVLAPPQLALQALMHDASEAYFVDIPTPIKNHMPEYKVIEHKLMCVIANKFGFDWPMDDITNLIDKQVLQLEWHHHVLNDLPTVKLTFTHIDLENKFLEVFRKLTE